MDNYTMPRTPITIISILLFLLPLTAAKASSPDTCKLVKITAERLADLNISRNAHAAFCVNGEVTVVGGHTKSFIPTATAEYYKDGEWHLINTEYTHDNGMCVVMKSGKVLLAGGSAEPMGVGQTYPVEEYDPATHSFRGFSCLSTKRTLAIGVELDSGKVAVTGNWYAKDGIEVFDGDRDFSHVKDVSVGRASPYLLRTSDNDVLIFGNGGIHGEVLLSDVVDRLKGEPLHEPLLRQWQPLFNEAPFCGNLGFIGDEAANDYSWLIPVQDWSVGDSTDWLATRPVAFLLVRDTTFTILPTTCPAPVNGPYGLIHYYSPVIADRQAHRGYVHGIDKDNHHYVLCVEYDKTPAPLTLYYTDPLPDAGFPEIVLTDDGNLMIIGGINYNKNLEGSLENDNFSPLASVYLLHLGTRATAQSAAPTHGWFWWIALAIVAVFAIVMLLLRKRCIGTTKSDGHDSEQNLAISPSDSATNDELIQRICELMESRKLYLNSDLKLNDVAAMLGTNRNQISTCINSKRGYSFSQFVGSYRIEYAKELMRRQKDIKIAEVWMQSGFTNETSFFRTFKLVTGLTPNEWKSNDYN